MYGAVNYVLVDDVRKLPLKVSIFIAASPADRSAILLSIATVRCSMRSYMHTGFHEVTHHDFTTTLKYRVLSLCWRCSQSLPHRLNQTII